LITKVITNNNSLDLLFVIDNSKSTMDKQTMFAQSFPQFVAALDAFPGGRPSLHIGVVDTTVDIGVTGYAPSCPSPDLQDSGLLQNAPQVAGCTPPPDRYIIDVTSGSGGARTTNYAGDLGSELQCIGEVGDDGCGFEAQLEAMKRALDGSNPDNAGFLRDGVPLAIVILTDEDDASVADSSVFTQYLTSDFDLQPLAAYTCDQAMSSTAPGTYTHCQVRENGTLVNPSSYVSFLASIKPPSMTYVGLVAAPPSTTIATGPLEIPGTGLTQPMALLPSCNATINGNPNIGRPGVRLTVFEQAFGDNGAFANVCQNDYTQALGAFANGMSAMIAPCLTGPISTVDVDAQNPGLQPRCSVVDATNYGAPEQTQTAIATCEMLNDTTPAPGQPTCWWVEHSPQCSTTTTGLYLNVVRSAPVAADVVTVASCAPSS
jgi:hypothetical protein